MKKILTLISIAFLAIIFVSLSPLVIKYSWTIPLVPGGSADDTITHVYSGFPIPYMHRTNLGMGMDINGYTYWADVVLMMGVVGGAWWIMRRRKKS